MSTMRCMLGIAGLMTLAACATKDSNADSIRADTISPGPQPEVAPIPGAASASSSTAATSSTAASTGTAPARPAPGAPVRSGTKTAVKRDTSHLGYDRAIPAKLDKAHTLPRAP